MKKPTSLFLFVAFLSLTAMSGCRPIPSPTATPSIPIQIPRTPTPTALALTLTTTSVPQGKTIVVNNSADSGSGTLRQALLDARPGDIVTFDPTAFPPDAAVTITLSSGLPDLSQGNLTIDASNAGVILDGRKITAPQSVHGLSISSNSNTIRGLQIVGFSNAGIALHSGAKYNVIGGDRGIGAGPLGQGNLLSGNGNFGIGLWDEGTSYNTIQGNYIGINLEGTATWGHPRDGIHSNGANHNLISGNVIGGNDSGVSLCCVAEGRNVVTANIIGTDESGANPLGNRLAGVLIDRTSYNVIGPDNIIAYNIGQGVMFWEDTPYNTVTQNSIHDNGERGISLETGNDARPVTPLIFDFDLQAGSLAGGACANCTVEIFSDSSDEGAIYEGRTEADSSGVFTFSKGVAFTGPHLTATATDPDGNTSEFSAPTSGTYKSLTLQEGNNLPKTLRWPKRLQELEDNHIGTDLGSYDPGYANTDVVYPIGFKWIRISFTRDPLNWQYVEIKAGEYTVDPVVDDLITEYANNGITIILNLGVGTGENRLDTARFRTEQEVDRYSNFVRFMVQHFKGRIAYYEIWNEPDTDTPWGEILVENYSTLIKQVVPVIRSEDPGAKIVIGAIGGHWVPDFPGYGEFSRYTLHTDYLTALLRSGVAPLVDVISWHPFYGHRPDDPYYQNYPQMVMQLRELATSEGFQGRFLVEEAKWRTASDDEPQMQGVTEVVAAKYSLRTIVMHRGLGFIVTIALPGAHDPTLQKVQAIHNMCDTMAAANPLSIPVQVQSEATNVEIYSFSLPNGDTLIALWTNGEAVEDDPGVITTLTLPGIAAQRVMGIDILHGFEQEMIMEVEGESLVIRNLLVKDYPIILRLSD